MTTAPAPRGARRRTGQRSTAFIGSLNLLARAADRLATLAQIGVVAWIFGASSAGDLYFLASIVPLTLALVIGDPLGRAALRSLSGRIDAEVAPRFAAAGFSVAFVFLAALTLLYVIVAIVAVKVATPTGSGALGPWLAFAPVIVCSGLSGYLGSLLVWTERYGWAAFQIPVASIAGLALMGVVAAATDSLTLIALAISGGYAVALVVAFVAVGRRLGRAWLVHQTRPDLRAALALPRAIASPAFGQLLGGQALVVLERSIALTIGVGAVSTLTYARGISAAPVFVAQAIGAGVYPGIVRAHSEGATGFVRDSFLTALRVILFVGGAFTFYFLFFGPSVGAALLQRGSLSVDSADRVGHALIAFAPATAATGVLIFVVAVLYGIGDFRGILERSLVAVGAYVILAPVLVMAFDAWGLALAFSLSQVIGAAFGLLLLGRKVGLPARELVRGAIVPAAALVLPVAAALGLYRATLSVIGTGVPTEWRGIVDTGSSFLLMVAVSGAVFLLSPLPESARVRCVVKVVLSRA